MKYCRRTSRIILPSSGKQDFISCGKGSTNFYAAEQIIFIDPYSNLNYILNTAGKLFYIKFLHWLNNVFDAVSRSLVIKHCNSKRYSELRTMGPRARIILMRSWGEGGFGRNSETIQGARSTRQVDKHRHKMLTILFCPHVHITTQMQ